MVLEGIAAAALAKLGQVALDKAVDVATTFLREYLAKQSGVNEEAGRQLIARLDLERVALAWAVEQMADPERAALLRVRAGAERPRDFQPDVPPAGAR